MQNLTFPTMSNVIKGILLDTIIMCRNISITKPTMNRYTITPMVMATAQNPVRAAKTTKMCIEALHS